MLKFKKITFVLLIILLTLFSTFVGGYTGLSYSATSIQSHKDWQQLNVAPTRVVQLLGFCDRAICVETYDGKRYRYIGCNHSTDEACWTEVTAQEIEPIIPQLYNPCMYEFEIPSPPTDTIQLLGAKVCGSGGDYYQSYALLEDGSVWKWDHSIGDLAGLGMLPGIILGALVGLGIGLLIAIIAYTVGWARIMGSNSVGGGHE